MIKKVKDLTQEQQQKWDSLFAQINKIGKDDSYEFQDVYDIVYYFVQQRRSKQLIQQLGIEFKRISLEYNLMIKSVNEVSELMDILNKVQQIFQKISMIFLYIKDNEIENQAKQIFQQNIDYDSINRIIKDNIILDYDYFQSIKQILQTNYKNHLQVKFKQEDTQDIRQAIRQYDLNYNKIISIQEYNEIYFSYFMRDIQLDDNNVQMLVCFLQKHNNELLQQLIKEYVQNRIQEILKDKDFIQIIKLYNKFSKFSRQFIIDKKIIQLMIKFYDSQMKTKFDKQVIIESLELFRITNDKDYFQNLYQQQLQIRLIYNTFYDIEQERFMIKQLQLICGNQYVQQFENMIKDIQQEVQIANINLKILNKNNWPKQNIIDINDLRFQNIQDQYLKENKKLQILYLQGITEIKFKQYTFITIPLQMFILMQFNKSNTIELNQLQIDINLLNQCINPFIEQQVLILQDNKLMVNQQFTSDQKIIKFNLQQKVQKVQKSVFTDRVYIIDCLILKIMKTNKQINHMQLINLIQQDISFQPSIQIIKQRIENLIDREFISRDTDNFNIYNYIA